MDKYRLWPDFFDRDSQNVQQRLVEGPAGQGLPDMITEDSCIFKSSARSTHFFW